MLFKGDDVFLMLLLNVLGHVHRRAGREGYVRDPGQRQRV